MKVKCTNYDDSNKLCESLMEQHHIIFLLDTQQKLIYLKCPSGHKDHKIVEMTESDKITYPRHW